MPTAPTKGARLAVAAIKEAHRDRLVAGHDFLTEAEEAAIVDQYCPTMAALALLARQRKIDELSPAARILEQRAFTLAATAPKE